MPRLTNRITGRRRGAAHARRRRRPRWTPYAPDARAPAPVAGAIAATLSARRDAGPQDRALYVCGCGHGFHAGVAVDVSCPHCGGAQAW